MIASWWELHILRKTISSMCVLGTMAYSEIKMTILFSGPYQHACVLRDDVNKFTLIQEMLALASFSIWKGFAAAFASTHVPGLIAQVECYKQLYAQPSTYTALLIIRFDNRSNSSQNKRTLLVLVDCWDQ